MFFLARNNKNLHLSRFVVVALPLLVALAVRSKTALAFQQQHSSNLPVPTTSSFVSPLALASVVSDGMCNHSEETSINVTEPETSDCAAVSRRNAVSGALFSAAATAFATASCCLPLGAAVAAEGGEAATPEIATTTTTPLRPQPPLPRREEPFTVVFAVRTDSQKPDDLSILEIEVRPDWAPLAAARFQRLVEEGFYNDAPFFRVLPGYVAQFGISADPALNRRWVYCDDERAEAVANTCQPPLPDEPRLESNQRGTISFASSGKNSRRTQVFVNLANNGGPPNFLDAQNFVPFARIVERSSGGDTGASFSPKKLNGEYGGKVNQGKAAYYGGEYFRAVFPRLSVIKDAKIL